MSALVDGINIGCHYNCIGCDIMVVAIYDLDMLSIKLIFLYGIRILSKATREPQHLEKRRGCFNYIRKILDFQIIYYRPTNPCFVLLLVKKQLLRLPFR